MASLGPEYDLRFGPEYDLRRGEKNIRNAKSNQSK